MKNYEQCMILVGRVYKTRWYAWGKMLTDGEFASVNFDYDEVKKLCGSKFENLVGFWHTHPHWPASPSWTDFDTMNGWTSHIGKDLRCLIHGTNGKYNYTFRYDKVLTIAPNPKVVYWNIGNFFWGEL